MKILVSGGAGFIGSHVVVELLNNQHEVIIIDNLIAGKEQNISNLAKFYKEDITSEKIELIFKEERPEIVIHHAAQIDVQTSLRNPIYDAQVNILGTLNILENSRKYGVKKIIYASSAAVYGEPKYLGIDELHPIKPLSFYGISKYTPEHYINAYAALYDLNYTILRYANVYGPRQDSTGEGGVISIFIDKLIKKDQLFIFGDGEQTRDFIFVEDVAKANISALTSGNHEIINVSTNTSVSINQLLNILNELNGTNIEPIYTPERSGDIKHSYLVNEKAKRILEWEPKYTLREGLKKTFEYYKRIIK